MTVGLNFRFFTRGLENYTVEKLMFRKKHYNCSKMIKSRSTVDGIKKIRKVFCSSFMSFYPIDFIFIGWIGDIWRIFWVPRNFEFKPANGIFPQKGKFPTFQKVLFLGVWCRKLSLNKIGVMDMSYIMDSGQNRLYTTFPNIFSLLSADPADLSTIQQKKIIFLKTCSFLNQNLL